MVKRKSEENPTIEELVEDIQTAGTSTVEDDIDAKRAELIRLSGDGAISQSETYIKKPSAKVIDKIWQSIRVEKSGNSERFSHRLVNQ